jgi:hypothetical protein
MAVTFAAARPPSWPTRCRWRAGIPWLVLLAVVTAFTTDRALACRAMAAALLGPMGVGG